MNHARTDDLMCCSVKNIIFWWQLSLLKLPAAQIEKGAPHSEPNRLHSWNRGAFANIRMCRHADHDWCINGDAMICYGYWE